MTRIVFFLWALLACTQLPAQDQNTTMVNALRITDSLLFNIGFNQCDIIQFDTLVSESFEFYHDQAGITHTKAAFIESIRNGICALEHKPLRELVPGSLEVYPLHEKGVLYGALQMGRHRFYVLDKNGHMRLTSTARFIHVWLIENGQWKLGRGFSYDHRE